MRKLLLRISCAMIMFSLGVGLHTIRPTAQRSPVEVTQIDNTPVVDAVPATPISETTETEPMRLSDIFTSEEALHYNGYLIEKRYKSITFDPDLEADQGYVVISKDRKVIQSFDGTYYHPLGALANFGFFSFLGSSLKQVVISQEVGRGGVQWIVDLSEKQRVVFDGLAWGVGRESSDCEVHDLDGDGVFEITVPITDFYALMDKMAMAGIPLPQITFQYDPVKKKYFPVNHVQSQSNASNAPGVPGESNELYFRSVVLGNMLGLIYQGKRDDAWQYFNAAYNLDDKKEIERRVQEILRDQPVYKYIYKQ